MKRLTLNSRGITHLVLPFLIVLGIAVVGTYLLVSSHAASKAAFLDISSPQCNRLDSIGHYRYGIVGLNGTKLDFAINSCVDKEVKHFDNYALYVGSNYPSSQCPPVSSVASAKRCGQKAARFDIREAESRGLRTKTWWIDVEVGDGIPWSTPTLNSAFLSGMRSTLRSHPGTTYVGFYSTQDMWTQITGNAHFPTGGWYATSPHPTSRPSSTALRDYCSKQFTGKANTLVQYVSYDNLDTNLPC